MKKYQIQVIRNGYKRRKSVLFDTHEAAGEGVKTLIQARTLESEDGVSVFGTNYLADAVIDIVAVEIPEEQPEGESETEAPLQSAEQRAEG